MLLQWLYPLLPRVALVELVSLRVLSLHLPDRLLLLGARCQLQVITLLRAGLPMDRLSLGVVPPSGAGLAGQVLIW